MNHKPPPRRLAVGITLVTLTALALGLPGGSSGAQSVARLPDRQALARHLLETRMGRILTAPARLELQMIAEGSRQLGFRDLEGPGARAAVATGGTRAQIPSQFTNVRVNDPSADQQQVDQTTQSETTIAVAGSNVAVGYNDSQHTPLGFEAASDLTGYSYSRDGGRTWVDGGVLPNRPEFNNVGDPWLTSDRSGDMFYASLAFDAFNVNGDLVVSRSTDGGASWRTPVPVIRPPLQVFYFADKEAITAGPDPSVPSRDNLYVAWDDFVSDPRTGEQFNGLPVARSRDHGNSWKVTYADKIPPDTVGCSFGQYIGAQPLVDPGNGTLYVAAEKITVDDPDCTGQGTAAFAQWLFSSTDGGKKFGLGVQIAEVTSAIEAGVLKLAPGRYMRTIEFPSLALLDGSLFAVWNDGDSGHSHIRMATSTDGGATWSLSWATAGNNDEVQPALSADQAGLHLLYYSRNRDGTLDVLLRDSTDGGASFSTSRVTTRSFPGVFTIPQFDPILAPGYMGDYIANTTDGQHQFFSWGDNRDVVHNFLWPRGRQDPDVFFASR